MALLRDIHLFDIMFGYYYSENRRDARQAFTFIGLRLRSRNLKLFFKFEYESYDYQGYTLRIAYCHVKSYYKNYMNNFKNGAVSQTHPPTENSRINYMIVLDSQLMFCF